MLPLAARSVFLHNTVLPFVLSNNCEWYYKENVIKAPTNRLGAKARDIVSGLSTLQIATAQQFTSAEEYAEAMSPYGTCASADPPHIKDRTEQEYKNA